MRLFQGSGSLRDLVPHPRLGVGEGGQMSGLLAFVERISTSSLWDLSLVVAVRRRRSKLNERIGSRPHRTSKPATELSRQAHYVRYRHGRNFLLINEPSIDVLGFGLPAMESTPLTSLSRHLQVGFMPWRLFSPGTPLSIFLVSVHGILSIATFCLMWGRRWKSSPPWKCSALCSLLHCEEERSIGLGSSSCSCWSWSHPNRTPQGRSRILLMPNTSGTMRSRPDLAGRCLLHFLA